jgi:hypothetical protein
MATPDPQAEIDAECAHEDIGIERAAMALAFAMRPALSAGAVCLIYPNEYWRLLTERDRRIFLYRARACVTAWEDYMNVDRHAEAQDG